jgi:hypothetical protein
MTEHEAIDRIVRALEAIACSTENLTRHMYQIRCLMTDAAEEAVDEEG